MEPTEIVTDKNFEIVEVSLANLPAYERIDIAFWVTERVASVNEPDFSTETATLSWYKDYDATESNRPSVITARFDTSNWSLLFASRNGEWIGGALIVFRCVNYDLTCGRNDLAVIHDFRVMRNERGKGVGRAIWNAIEEWATIHRARELRVETQDINVPACRFYRAMGCQLHSVDESAYGAGCSESQLIWSKSLNV